MDNENKFVMTVEEAIRCFSTDVFRMAYVRTNNKSDAEDITQNVFLKYLREKKSFHNEEHVKAWLLRVAINDSKNLVGSAWYRKNASIDYADSLYTEMEEKSEVYYAVMKLPEKYRVVIQLYYYEGYSVAEIGDMLLAKETTVKTWLLRARGRLKKLLKEDIDV